MTLYHAILTCGGPTDAEAANAPADIVEEFRHRPWHQNVSCRWDGHLLWLEAENDYDPDGSALLDEFWDAVIACVSAAGTLHFEVVSVEPVADRA
jgi:hypothetical protein